MRSWPSSRRRRLCTFSVQFTVSSFAFSTTGFLCRGRELRLNRGEDRAHRRARRRQRHNGDQRDETYEQRVLDQVLPSSFFTNAISRLINFMNLSPCACCNARSAVCPNCGHFSVGDRLNAGRTRNWACHGMLMQVERARKWGGVAKLASTMSAVRGIRRLELQRTSLWLSLANS